MRTPIVTQAETIKRLHASLRTCRGKVRSLERQNARLLSTDYQMVAEREIRLLEERIIEIEARWLEAEMDVLRLQRQVRNVA